MRTMRIAGTDLDVSRVALGCMRLGSDPCEVIAAVGAALEYGINFFDHADIYGRGQCEQVFSVVWNKFPGLRNRFIVQSKCGNRFARDADPLAPRRYDFSSEHILRSVEGSLRRLQTDHLDILLLHRPDVLVEPEEVARAFDVLERDGKVRYFGVSNHSGSQIDLLAKYVRQPLVVNQLQFNVLHAPLLDAGILANQVGPARSSYGEGTVEYCRSHGITIQTWGSLARGILTGKVTNTTDEYIGKAGAIVAELAQERQVSPEAVLIAWLLRHPAQMQAIIGTTNPERIRAACQGDALEITREDWYRLFIAGRGAELP
jgi:predicted oxidoreductase